MHYPTSKANAIKLGMYLLGHIETEQKLIGRDEKETTLQDFVRVPNMQ